MNDDRLSFRARGVLVWLLDKPDDWRTNAAAIARAGAEGRDAVRAALNELEEQGYMTREKCQGENGQWYTLVTVYESTTKPQVAPKTENQASVSRTSVNRSSVSQAFSSSETDTDTDNRKSYPEDGMGRIPEPRGWCDACEGTGRARNDAGDFTFGACPECAA